MLAGLGLLLTIRARSLPWTLCLGASGPLLLHCWLQSKVTGTPLPAEMYPEAFNYPGSFWLTPTGIFHEYGARHWFALELLVGPPGWLTLTPVLAFGLVGLALVLLRRGDPLRPMAAMVLGSLVVLVVYYTWMVRRTDFAASRSAPGTCWRSRRRSTSSRSWPWSGSGVGSRPRAVRALMGVGFFYAYYGAWDPWSRIEEREVAEPTLKLAQRFVIYPYSRTRHKLELEQDRAKAAPPVNPPRARP